MPKLDYLMRVASGMSLEKLRQCVNDAHERSGKPKALLLADIIHCARKFGAGYYDYLIFEFYNMNDEERATYMTRMRNKRFDDMINDPEDCAIFDDKSQFYAHFSDFMGRDWRDLAKTSDEDLAAYLEGHEYVIAKPNDGECGHGIEKIRLADFASLDEAVAYLRQPEKNFGVVEDLLIQHPEMSRLYPYAVNCMRMATVYWKGESHLLYSVLKTGNHGKFVGNLENGGYACHMDLETGKVTGPGHTNKQELVEEHPMTGVRFEGFQVPYFEEACELAKRAAAVVPTVGYIGWDMAITENGPAIIEGNHFAAYDFPQLPDRSQNHRGLAAMLEDIGIRV